MRNLFRFTVPGRLSLLLVYIVSLLALSSLATPVYATGASIQLSPDNGPPNTTVTVTGKGFGVQETVIVTFDGQQVGSAVTNGKGQFKVKFTVSSNAQPGFHLVQATGQASGHTARATFEVQYQWQIVHSPKTGSLLGVAALSSMDVWTVGSTGSKPLTEHWNGSSWTIVSSPSPDSSSSLTGVAVVSSSDVWAVGYTSTGTLTEHWNGSYWTIISSPNPSSYSGFTSVAVVSANDIWAAGYNDAKTLTEHWNGSTWTHVPSPSPNGGPVGDELSALVVNSINNVWAVGSYGSGDGFSSPLIENWNGIKWSVFSSPSQGDTSYLQGAALVPGTSNIWAVGYYSFFSSPNYTLTEYYG